VFNAIIISISALIILLILGYLQLYQAQNTSVFMYSVTKVIPVPVATVDGQPVPYSDYLMKYRSSVHYLEQKEQISLKSDDGKRQVDFIKQQSLEDAIADSYAVKLARELVITVSDVELETFLKLQRQSVDGEVSQQTYDAVILDYYGWGADEYRHATKIKLLRQKVAYAVDQSAQDASTGLAQRLTQESNLQSIVEETNKTEGVQLVYGASGLVPKTNQDGGLAAEAAKLGRGALSSAIKSTTGDGYYYLKLLDINETQVSYEYIQVPLSEFNKRLDALTAANKISQYITLSKVDNTL